MHTLNQITPAATSTQEETMSSRELAKLTGKQLKHIHRDIARMLEQVHGPDVDHLIERDNRGYIAQYNLPRRECEILITGYDVKLRAAVIDRWRDLESGKVKPLHAPAQPAQPVEIDYDRIVKTVISTLKAVGALDDLKPKKEIRKEREEAISAENAFNLLETRLIEFVAKSSNKIIYRTALAQKLGGKKYQASLLAVAGRASLVEAVDLIVSRSDVLKKSGKKVYI